MFNFVVFMILFLAGMWLMGIAHELPSWQAVAFGGGILLVSLALALVVHAPGTDTRRSRP